MDLTTARAAKTEAAALVRELLAGRVDARAAGPDDDGSGGTRASRPPVGVSVGLTPLADGGFGLAVRYRLGVPTARMVARRVAEHAGPQVDIRRTGRIRAVPPVAPRQGRDQGGIGTRPPVVTAQALGETDRVRPLRPGVSIAHVDVSAGTLGAFVRVGEQVHVLSNFHVLAGSARAQAGDPILQPGPADGGIDPRDKVGELAAVVELEPGVTAHVDAALATLDDPDVEPVYPVGRVTSVAEVLGAEEVEKIGRTTGVTRGRITAIELDDVVVGYGPGLGEISFDDQIEVEGLGTAPFSRGGDSGSLVYRTPDGAAVGLLFAGSESGGENGTGLTYLNPIGTVLESLGATLLD